MNAKKCKQVVKCPGRFKELREYLYNELIPIVLEDRKKISKEDLHNISDLISIDRWKLEGLFDKNDSYYNLFKGDIRKKIKIEDWLSWIPLFSSEYEFDEELLRKYFVESMQNSSEVSERIIDLFRLRGDINLFKKITNKDLSSLILPEGENLSGYGVSFNYGIGTLSNGGAGGGGIRSDSPFIFEVYKLYPSQNEKNLAGIIGFWIQDNDILVSQMQPCRNASLPQKTPFGITLLKLLECMAAKMKFQRGLVYSARINPLFKEHPESWNQHGSEFVCMWDNSARKLGYVPTDGRNGHYFKNFQNFS